MILATYNVSILSFSATLLNLILQQSNNPPKIATMVVFHYGKNATHAPHRLILTQSAKRGLNDHYQHKFSVEEAIKHQLDALKYNDQPRPDYRIEVMYRFAGFDPFERSTYFGWFFDLGQFERFRRIYHHSTYRVLLGHKERKILSKQIQATSLGLRKSSTGGRNIPIHYGPGLLLPGFVIVMKGNRIGGSWDGYWLIESVLNDGGDAFAGGMAY
ncbi:hypothetical protein ACFE04_015159 [Oxalis oulophora]